MMDSSRRAIGWASEIVLVIGIGLACLIVPYSTPLGAFIDIGAPGVTFPGLYRAERNDQFDYAYTAGDLLISLPFAGQASHITQLRLSGPASAPVPARLELAGASVALGDVAAPRIYTVLTQLNPAGRIDLHLHSGVIQLAGEPRQLGVLIDWLRVQSAGGARPADTLRAGVLILVFLTWAALRVTAIPLRWRLLIMALVGVGLGLFFAAARAWTSSAPIWLAARLILGVASAIILAPPVRRMLPVAARLLVARRGVAILYLVVILLIYGPALSHGFLSDDYNFLFFARYGQPTDLWRHIAPPPALAPQQGYFRPLGLLSWGVLYRLAGLWPAPYYFVALGLHLLNTILVYRLGLRLGMPGRTAACAGLLFVVSPAQGEAVVWLSSRFDLLATLFVLLALLTSLDRHQFAWAAATGFVLLGLLSKETAIVAPALLVIAHIWRNRPAKGGLTRDLAAALIPTSLLCVAYLAWRWHIFGGPGGSLNAAGRSNVLSAGVPQVVELFGHLSAFLAAPLNWVLLIGQAAEATLLGAWPIALAVAVGAIWVLRVLRSDRLPGLPSYTAGGAILFGLAWIVMASLPLVGSSGWLLSTYTNGRYTYLPAIGACFALGALLCDIELVARSGQRLRRWGWWRPACLGLMVALCTAVAITRVAQWGAASSYADRYLQAIIAAAPAPEPQTTQVLPPPPKLHAGAYLFQNGLREALILRYDDPTLKVRFTLPPPGERPPRPDRLRFFVASARGPVIAPDAAKLAALMQLRAAVPGLTDLSWSTDDALAQLLTAMPWRMVNRSGCLVVTQWAPQEVSLALPLRSDVPGTLVKVSLNQVVLARARVGRVADAVTLDLVSLPVGTSQICVQREHTGAVGPGAQQAASLFVGLPRVALSQLLSRPPAPAIPLTATILDGLTLVGLDLLRAPGPLEADQEIQVITYWKVTGAPVHAPAAILQVMDAQGSVVAVGQLLIGNGPTAADPWPVGAYRRSVDIVRMPDHLPAGAYRLQIANPGPNGSDQPVDLAAFAASDRPDVTIWR